MPPLSLLFSSDRETTRLLRQAFYELEFEVDHCPEIFAAVQRLTNRSYDVIVTDFDDGLEASFLLKTSRELKSNSGAFTLAITSDRDANAAARKVGADLVLNKPIVTEVAKYSLLTSDAFLHSMKNWLPKLQIGRVSAPSSRILQPAQAEHRVRPRKPEMSVPLAEWSGSASGRFRDGSFRDFAPSPAKCTEPVAFWPYVPGERVKRHRRSTVGLLIATTAMMMLSVGYVFSEPTRTQAVVNSVATVCQQALAHTESWLRAPQPGTDNLELAQSQDSQSPSVRPPHIRVSEIHDPVVMALPKLEPTPQASQMEVQHPPTEFARMTPPPPIPPSLKMSFSSAADAPARVSPSLLFALQPVDLPEDFSTKLILQRVEPNYPAQALQAGLQGAVVLRAWIGKDGKIEDVKLIRGSLLLGQAAYHAVKQWRYKPYMLNGQAVETQTYVTLDFKLP